MKDYYYNRLEEKKTNNKQYTENDFIFDGEIIDYAEGRWSNKDPYYWGKQNEGKFSVNLSSILTFLIKKAGAICDHYASDLFIDWNVIENHLKNPDLESENFLLGFRSMGVDGNSFVLNKYNNISCWNPEHEYMHNGEMEVYLLKIIIEDGEWIRVELGKAKLNEDEENV